MNGGTSMSAPLVASLFTRINDERIAVGKGPIGFANPTLYANPQMFNDITVGNQSQGGCGTSGFSCVPVSLFHDLRIQPFSRRFTDLSRAGTPWLDLEHQNMLNGWRYSWLYHRQYLALACLRCSDLTSSVSGESWIKCSCKSGNVRPFDRGFTSFHYIICPFVLNSCAIADW